MPSGELANVTTKPSEMQALPQVLTELTVSHPWMPAGADEGDMGSHGTQERAEECQGPHGAPGSCSPGAGTGEMLEVSSDPGDIGVVELTDEDVSGDEEDISDRLLRDDGVSIHAQNIRVAGPSQQNPGSHGGTRVMRR